MKPMVLNVLRDLEDPTSIKKQRYERKYLKTF